MASYQQILDPITLQVSVSSILRLDDGATIPFDPNNADYVAYEAWLAAGHTPEAPAAAVVPQPTYISRLVIVDRLHAAGLLPAALTALAADSVSQARWQAATEILTTDATALALLMAIGADPAVILAP
ncbi:MAG TPA: hypothetical protein VNT30_09430 [Stellaceae bacterium]|nr:hypothetical protein [Stellaceae bacterium]